MSDALRKGIRAFFQTFLGVVIGSGVLSAFDTTGVVDWAAIKKVLVSAAFAGITSVVVFGHNWLEDNTSFPAVLKATPSAGENPVTHDPPK